MGNKQLIMIPGPTNVPDRILEAASKPIINHRGSEFHDLYDRILNNLRYAFETSADTFVLSASGTGGIEAVIANFVGQHEKIIIPVNGDFSYRIEENARYFGGIPVVLNIQWGKAPTAALIEEAIIEESDARIVFVIYNETSTGALTKELPEIARVVRKYDKLLAVDAISNFAGDPLPMDSWGVDIVVAGSQKCLACPPGLCLVAVSPRAWEFIRNKKAGSNYWDLKKYKVFNERRETPFTPAVNLFFALDEGLKMLREEGLQKRIDRHAKMSSAFYAAAEALNLELFSDHSCRAHTVIAIRNPPKIDVAKMRKVMEETYDVVIAGGMGAVKDTTFRIGSMGIVSSVEVKATVQALEKGLEATGYVFEKGAGVDAVEETLA